MTALLFTGFVAPASGVTYYISLSGSDLAGGQSPESAWQSVARVNAHPHEPGDTYLFEGGWAFTGGLQIWAGDPRNPITVSSYGQGRATIASGMERGLWSCSPGGLRVSNLNFVGAGADVNPLYGLELCNWGGPAAGFYIENVDVSGYFIGMWISGDRDGVRDVRITRSAVHHNGNGLHIGGYGEQPSDRGLFDLYIGYVRAYSNDTAQPVMGGIGMSLFNVSRAVIERSLIHDNGVTSPGPGHAGMLVSNCDNLLVQHNEVYRNRDTTWGDGQGIAFVPVSDSVVQYNYTHDNDSAGFHLGSEEVAYPSRRNTFRYNISENDLVGLYLGYQVWDVQAYNNTIYVGAPNGFAIGVQFSVFEGGGNRFRNNIIHRGNERGVHVMVADDSLPYANGFLFQGNTYYSMAGGSPLYVIYGQTGYYSLPQWRSATGQELLGDQPVGFTDDPELVNPGGGGTIGNPDLLSTLSAYKLRSTSPVRDMGLHLPELFGIDVGSRDFFGNAIPTGGGFDIGAHEFRSSRPQGVDFDGDGISDKVMFRPGNGTWYVHRSDGTGQLIRQWGVAGDVPVPGDYGGDFRSDFVVWRPSNGTWYVQTSEGLVLPSVAFGALGDIPVPGDYGGDGRTDFAVWRPSSGVWFVLTAEGTMLAPVSWGVSGSVPVPGDYDGDGYTDMAVYHQGMWHVRRSGGGTISVGYGLGTDVARVGDYSGDGRADFVIFRPSNATWYVLRSDTLTGLAPVSWGLGSDVPLPANMAGDSRADYVVWRPSNGTWYVHSSEGTMPPPLPYGAPGDIPIAR